MTAGSTSEERLCAPATGKIRSWNENTVNSMIPSQCGGVDSATSSQAVAVARRAGRRPAVTTADTTAMTTARATAATVSWTVGQI